MIDNTGFNLITTNFGFSISEIERLLTFGLQNGGNFSELFFEYVTDTAVTIEEGLVKNSSELISLGVGIRVIEGTNFGYAYTNELTFESIKNAMLTASAIAQVQATKFHTTNLQKNDIKQNMYAVDKEQITNSLQAKIALIQKAHDSAIAYDNRIQKVTASFTSETQFLTIANSEGLLISDVRPQSRLSVAATAINKNEQATGRANVGGRVSMDFYGNDVSVDVGKKAAEEAIILLGAKNAPAGEMPVVLDKSQAGVLIHEAVGHPFEADAIWKKTSNMCEKMGEKVGSALVTIYDNPLITNSRGSLNIDDEGSNCENTLLMEDGKVVGFINDKLSAEALGHKRNGHARRQSYECPPIPRMTNTILAAGDTAEEDVIKGIKRGFYAKSFQGGMVEGTGKFTFSVSLGYLIEDGKRTAPLKNATLIGTNTTILQNIDCVSGEIDYFLGTCGKGGQSVAVTAGTPTFRVKTMTVGGII